MVFGLDAPRREELPLERLRALLREGPPAGRHLLGWWRSVPPFAGLLGPEGEVDKLTAVAVPTCRARSLRRSSGRPVQWRPRPGRAVLWDGPDDRGTVLVPFADGGQPTAGGRSGRPRGDEISETGRP